MIEQCVYDELMQFVLEVISSYSYLNSIGILRSEPLKVANLGKKFKDNMLDPGIYPIKLVDGSVHYYAVRNEEDGYQTIANGYKTTLIKHKNSKGLNVQPNNSHGLCQTFALMYYMHKDHLLKKGKVNYLDNITIGLKYLTQFIKEDYYNRERLWSINEILNSDGLLIKHCENHTDTYRREILRKIKGKQKNISLTSLLNFLNRNIKNKEEWFYGS